MQVGSGSVNVVTIPAGTTLSAAVTLLNANAGIISQSITASTSTNTLVLTGPVGATGSSTLVVSPSALTFTTVYFTATFATQGSTDGTNYFPLLMAAIAAPGTKATTENPTANSLYVVNVAGLTQVRFVTSSTFTSGLTLSIRLVVSSNDGPL